MKRRIYNTLLYTLLVLFLAQFALAYAALAPRLFFPHVANGAVQTRLIKLVDHDAGFVDAVATPDCRYFVNWQSRPDGKVHATEQITDTLHELPPPALAPQSVQPAYELPGPKQGSSDMVICGNEKRTYFTGRDDPTGPFFVWVLIEPIPPLVGP